MERWASHWRSESPLRRSSTPRRATYNDGAITAGINSSARQLCRSLSKWCSFSAITFSRRKLPTQRSAVPFR